jgi:hypothetical protein
LSRIGIGLLLSDVADQTENDAHDWKSRERKPTRITQAI